MAITRQTQRDIGNYEAKFIGPFTARQAGLLGAGAVIVGVISTFLKALGAETSSLFGVVFFVMAPFAFLAFGKKWTYGMNPEDFIKEYYFYHFQAPRVRKYQTETYDDILEIKMIKEQKSASSNKSSSKKTKDAEDTGIKDIRAGHFKKFEHKENPKYKSIE